MRLLPADLHLGTRTSVTAQWTALGRALELTREPSARIVSDPLAPLFLDRVHRQVLRGAAAGPAGVRHTLERSEFTAIATSALCRHRAIDAALLETLPEVDQVVVLGAGYDTRAHRFATAIGRRPVFEVDLAPMSRQKAAVVAARPRAFRSRQVVRVETDFAARPLRTALVSAGFRPGSRTFVAWEGVTMYLPQASVRATLDDLAAVCGSGSTLAADFFRRVPGVHPVDIVRRAAGDSLRLVGEPLRYEPDPDVAEAVLAGCGFEVVDLADGDQLTRRHATGGRRCDAALYVVKALSNSSTRRSISPR
ncbi:SAM-dependent methyltransferase [Jatrophihabitans endophyticus]|uniref:SAM-dependent methyltransferase n=1 Tax=Jatrophihabitans endophyticus TaxID=1206085 RepID=UPI0019E302FF|nr:SAM-dependent methyltransferase [Jatrophihabitans endophyticus]MBE7189546.1 SAM-dependent methyltransferase [Jatrophihabitans endophyticus]